MSEKFTKLQRYPLQSFFPGSWSGHLHSSRPRFRKALGCSRLDHDTVESQGTLHKQLWRRFHDCDDAVRARLLDGKTSRSEGLGRHLRIATPTNRQEVWEGVTFQSYVPLSSLAQPYYRAISCSSLGAPYLLH